MKRFQLKDREQQDDIVVESLVEYFKSNPYYIKEERFQNGERHILVPSVYPKSEMEFDFLILFINYDVYRLEFIGSIG